MTIYKTHFLPANKIFKILGLQEQEIRQSYSGGAVDVYIPALAPRAPPPRHL
jgi:hypothetical protein